MKIAVHFDQDLRNFCHGWIEVLSAQSVTYKIVNCKSDNIIDELTDYDVLMWHWFSWDIEAMRIAPILSRVIEGMGKRCYPNSLLALTFDDKVGQYYVFKSLNVRTIETKLFFTRKDSEKWLKNAAFPIIHKLSGGAGSVNVNIVRDKVELYRLIKYTFGRGLPKVNYSNILKDRKRRLLEAPSKSHLRSFFGGIYHLIKFKIGMYERSKGYLYLQNYIKTNSDIRVIVFGDKAIGIRRYNRPGDFKASGSGIISYDRNDIPITCVDEAFKIAKRMHTELLALDFLSDGEKWYAVEMSYGFVSKYYKNCPGYWDNNLLWHEREVFPEALMVESIVEGIV